MKNKNIIIFYVLLFVLVIVTIIFNPVAYSTDTYYQEIKNLTFIKTDSGSNLYNYNISFLIDNISEQDKVYDVIHIELFNSSKNTSELLEISSIIIEVGSKEEFGLKHGSKNDYDSIKIFTTSNGERIQKASFEIENESLKTIKILEYISVVLLVLLVLLIVINMFSIKKSSKAFIWISRILFLSLTALLLIVVLQKNTDLQSIIIDLLPLYSIQYFTEINSKAIKKKSNKKIY